MTIRVRIPAYTDQYLDGEREGVLVKTTRQKATGMGRMLAANASGMIDIAHVKLDKSGKTYSFLLDDCEWISNDPLNDATPRKPFYVVPAAPRTGSTRVGPPKRKPS